MSRPVEVTARSDYLTSIALPMVLVGAGQGSAFAPLTNAGIAGVAEEAGAASGLVNTATGSASPSDSASWSRPARPGTLARGSR